ncbi:hypothetical protein thalar_00058 [Litoreibacter arenae DSM 19593]|uniref:Uncharacterized protein n=1 Tax=Litoreibacter arenae DSM 19593 TaxID=1123360 RepID=S9QPI6_9RHOB|nr:hypothetical protein thalar_00058 [Litoreibacter arenae DSM 19593]
MRSAPYNCAGQRAKGGGASFADHIICCAGLKYYCASEV